MPAAKKKIEFPKGKGKSKNLEDRRASTGRRTAQARKVSAVTKRAIKQTVAAKKVVKKAPFPRGRTVSAAKKRAR